MCSGFLSDKRDMYDALIAEGVAKRRARELQNLMVHCKYETFGIDSALESFVQYDIVVATTNIDSKELKRLAQAATEAEITLCIMSPSLDRARDMACREIVEQHRCTTIDNRGYLLVFNNYLPKQKFKL